MYARVRLEMNADMIFPDSYGQIIITNIRPAIRVHLPPRSILPPSGRRDYPNILGRGPDGGNRDPLRPGGIHLGALRQCSGRTALELDASSPQGQESRHGQPGRYHFLASPNHGRFVGRH